MIRSETISLSKTKQKTPQRRKLMTDPKRNTRIVRTFHPYFFKYFVPYTLRIVNISHSYTYSRFFFSLPNKFNLNCLQPAHALDTRQPHLRFNILLVCFARFAFTRSLCICTRWLPIQFNLLCCTVLDCVNRSKCWMRIQSASIAWQSKRTAYVQSMCNFVSWFRLNVRARACVRAFVCMLTEIHCNKRYICTHTNNKKGNVRVYRLILMFTRIERNTIISIK